MLGSWAFVMAGSVEHWTTSGLIVLASGFVALCVLLWLCGRWLGRTRAVASVDSVRSESIVSVDGERVAGADTVGSVVLFQAHLVEIPAIGRERVDLPLATQSIDAEVAAEVSADVVVPVRRRPRPAWELAVEGQTPASLLAKAHGLLSAGDHDEAAVQLRACARLASKLKEVAVEAVARLELGDLARSHGDMTTACEHWQLARSLYGELKRADEAKAAENRMEKAGCPTDWVLTKF
jgi:hypothetical protein